MKACIGVLLVCSMAAAAMAQNTQKTDDLKTDGLTPSKRVPGPHGLEGWTLQGPIPDQPNDKFPFTLVIARNGREIRRIDGSAFIWKWKFLDDGRKVAYESGPLHFSLACVLFDVGKGKELATYDCFREIPANAPQWVQTLESNP